MKVLLLCNSLLHTEGQILKTTLIAGQVLKTTLNRNDVDRFKGLYETKLKSAFLTALIAKRNIQQEVYSSDENILRFMKLWQNHHSTDIAFNLWNKK